MSSSSRFHSSAFASGMMFLSAGAVIAAPGALVPAQLPGAEPFAPELVARLEAALASRPADFKARTRHLREDGGPRFTNRLALELSPYLRQHSHNPVDWFPCGDEAFEAARRRGVPVLLSIGYSTCHWCHVMEEESFDDEATAAYLNAHFVAIKVDRETRPDVDSVYMTALQAMGERGGWPLNVWLTADREPFFGGTYFPPREGMGRPSFRSVLERIHERYAADPSGIQQSASRLAAAIEQALSGERAASSWVPSAASAQSAAAFVREHFDPQWGGLQQRIKFPSTLPVGALLRVHRNEQDEVSLRIVEKTLERMAQGGIRDHLGGGFHRYSTDPQWLVPHFEKMLYDNALLVPSYLEAWQVTQRQDFAAVAREILDYLLAEMQAEAGGFYSATDADSAGPDGELEEGLFFSWTLAELEATLGKPDARLAAAWYGVAAVGPLEGRSVLHTWEDPEALAKRLGVSTHQLAAAVERARAALLAARAERPPPLRDEKIIAAWNGLAISAMSRAGFAFGEARYVAAASRAAEFVLSAMRTEGRLHRVSKDGVAVGPAFLDDYAFLIAGLLDLYQADPQPRWLAEALALQAIQDRHYADDAGGGYALAADDHEQPLAREKPTTDGAVPSGNSVAALNLLRLAALTGKPEYRERASMLFAAQRELLTQSPNAVSELLLAVDFALDRALEIVIVLPPETEASSSANANAGRGDADTDANAADSALVDVLRRSFVPNHVRVIAREGGALAEHAEQVAFVAGKRAREGKATAYVCENRVCDLPTTDPAVFAKQLQRKEPLAEQKKQ